jgi:catechol 2,3-dioxygenase-like lactoylglutathione lyase family enzyme
MLELGPVHHLSLEVRDLGRSLGFWRDLLGFREMPRPDLGFPGAWLEHAGLGLHLIEGRPPTRPVEIGTRADHIAFRVADVEAAEMALTQAGVRYRVNIQRSTGLRQLFLHDPDGNTVELAPAHSPVDR